MTYTMFLLRIDSVGYIRETWIGIIREMLYHINRKEEFGLMEVYKIDYIEPQDFKGCIDCYNVKLVFDDDGEIDEIIYPHANSDGTEYILTDKAVLSMERINSLR